MTDQTTRSNSEKKYKSGRLRILLYFHLVLILLILLTAASYSWFSLSKLNRVSNLSLYVNAPVGMQIAASPDAEEWGLQLAYQDLVTESSPLRPVTWSERDQKFYAATYGFNGQLKDEWMPLSDELNSNGGRDSYYCVATLYGRTDERVTVSLAPAAAAEEGRSGTGTYLLGKTLWDSEKIANYNGGFGAENAVRIGIRITKLDRDFSPLDEDPLFVIYEPNSDRHADSTEGYVDTPSIDGTESLVPQSRLITQNATVWTESEPVEKGVVLHKFGEFNGETKLFSLETDETVKIQLYIWLEGQDIDCTNSSNFAVNEAQITANVQFSAVTDHQSGMEPIKP